VAHGEVRGETDAFLGRGHGDDSGCLDGEDAEGVGLHEDAEDGTDADVLRGADVRVNVAELDVVPGFGAGGDVWGADGEAAVLLVDVDAGGVKAAVESKVVAAPDRLAAVGFRDGDAGWGNAGVPVADGVLWKAVVEAEPDRVAVANDFGLVDKEEAAWQMSPGAGVEGAANWEAVGAGNPGEEEAVQGVAIGPVRPTDEVVIDVEGSGVAVLHLAENELRVLEGWKGARRAGHGGLPGPAAGVGPAPVAVEVDDAAVPADYALGWHDGELDHGGYRVAQTVAER
jgi:hypothetical protein